MEKKIRVGAVSYLNTKPLIYGFSQMPLASVIELILDYPANLTTLLQKDKLDVALLPVASIPNIHDANIISDYCIGTNEQVASVCIFSEVPIEEIQEIYLDYQSKTSVMLLRILLNEYWQIRPSLLPADEDYIKHIKDKTAGLVIGDRALDLLNKYPYVYDLGEAWHAFTQLPFVFATWVSNKKLPLEFIESFNKANQIGLDNINEIATSNVHTNYDIATYYTQNISYKLDDEKRKGLTMFLKMIEKLN